MPADSINPSHYKCHPSGVECVDIAENLPFLLGNAVKYIWRAGSKPDVPYLEDLRKAHWYLIRYQRTNRGCISSNSATDALLACVLEGEPSLFRYQVLDAICSHRRDIEGALKLIEIEIARHEGVL